MLKYLSLHTENGKPIEVETSHIYSYGFNPKNGNVLIFLEFEHESPRFVWLEVKETLFEIDQQFN